MFSQGVLNSRRLRGEGRPETGRRPASDNRRPPPRNVERYYRRSTSRSRSRRPVYVSNHLLIMLTTLVSCALLTAFLIYDQVYIYNFFSKQNAIWEGSTVTAVNQTQEMRDEGESTDTVLKQIQSYTKQRALGAALLVLLLLQVVAGVGVYIGVRMNVQRLLLGYLVLTFPVMTFAMVYAILFMVDASSTFLYVKIISVILVYTIQANMYRLVYRMYQSLKYEARRGSRGQNNSYSENNNRHNTPVVIQLKPPPYEKEPPPYSPKLPEPSPAYSCEDPNPQPQPPSSPTDQPLPPVVIHHHRPPVVTDSYIPLGVDHPPPVLTDPPPSMFAMQSSINPSSGDADDEAQSTTGSTDSEVIQAVLNNSEEARLSHTVYHITVRGPDLPDPPPPYVESDVNVVSYGQSRQDHDRRY